MLFFVPRQRSYVQSLEKIRQLPLPEAFIVEELFAMHLEGENPQSQACVVSRAIVKSALFLSKA